MNGDTSVESDATLKKVPLRRSATGVGVGLRLGGKKIFGRTASSFTSGRLTRGGY